MRPTVRLNLLLDNLKDLNSSLEKINIPLTIIDSEGFEIIHQNTRFR